MVSGRGGELSDWQTHPRRNLLRTVGGESSRRRDLRKSLFRRELRFAARTRRSVWPARCNSAAAAGGCLSAAGLSQHPMPAALRRPYSFAEEKLMMTLRFSPLLDLRDEVDRMRNQVENFFTRATRPALDPA